MTLAYDPLLPPIQTSRVRYVKLGPQGSWERDCVERGILRVDFDTGSPEGFAMCSEGRWSDLAVDWARSKSKGVATRFTNETRTYFEDSGDILWITFANDKLYWGFLEADAPRIFNPDDPNDTSTFRRVRGGWKDTDIFGLQLTKTSLPGSLKAAASFRGTSFDLASAQRDRLIDRINGVRTPAVEQVQQAQKALEVALGALIQTLDDRDFEALVDMLFLAAGWRRLGRVGGVEKTKDLDLRMPITGERAFVQIKCQTSPGELTGYVRDFDRMDQYDRMFFVYHSGHDIACDREDVEIIGLKGVIDMVIKGGFVDWVLERVG